MVGNDIIDIDETSRSSDWERPGFMEKIFTPKEQSIISASDDPFTTVWQMWSMKESAYKIFIQAGGERFFNPTKIECSFVDSRNDQVKIDNITLKTRTLFNADYIFSTATIEQADIESRIFELPENDNQKQSDFMRKQLIKDFAKINNLNCGDLEIRKIESGIPLIYCKNEILDVSISITHHGKFGAYSFMRK